MNENEVFNQKLEQIGGGKIVEGISIKGENKDKILNFINANTNQDYILNGDKLEKIIKEEDVKNTLLDEEINQAIVEKRKIVIALADNVENKIKLYRSENNAARIILIDTAICEQDILEDVSCADRLTKALFTACENNDISLLSTRAIASKNTANNSRSSTAIIAVIGTDSDVYHGPDSSNYARVGSVDAGESPVYILARSMGWYHIEYVVTSTGKHKTGYIPAEAVTSYSGGEPTEEDFYGGYCYATAELDIRTCDDFSLTAPVGTLFKDEGCTFLFSYYMGDKEVAFIEYATSSGTKRGYVYSNYLHFPCETIVCIAKEDIPVYSGPNFNTYAKAGTIYKNELISLVAKESNIIYVEYNTTKGRKRGYVDWYKVNPRDYTPGTVFADFYPTPDNSACHVIDESITVYGGPSTSYANVGSVRNENIVCFWSNNENFNLTCIEYVVASTGLQKRGYIETSKIVQGPKALENNPLEEFYPNNYFSKFTYGRTQLNRDLCYLKAGSGPKHIFLVFAQHGWEDGRNASGALEHGDGNMLLKIAKNFINRFLDMDYTQRNTILDNWSIYIFPGINLDGLVNGYDNNGFGRCFYNGIDPNRSWPGNFKVFTSPRNKTGPTYLGATELVQFKDCLMQNASNDENILIDVHGWENSFITNSTTLSDCYLPKLRELNSSCIRKSLGISSGFLATWAENTPTMQVTASNMPGLGATSALLEFPPTTDYSDSNAAVYGGKFFDATIDLLLKKCNSAPITHENDQLITQLTELYNQAKIWNLSNNVEENNKTVLDYLRHETYTLTGNGTIYSTSDLGNAGFVDTLKAKLRASIKGGAFDFVSGTFPVKKLARGEIMNIFVGYAAKKAFFEAIKNLNKNDLRIENIQVHINALNTKIPLDHFAITTLTYMNRVNPYFRDLNGWAGDLIQLLGECQLNHDSSNYEYTADQFMKLIGCRYDSDLENTGFDSISATGFDYQDLYQDMDALILSDELRTKPIYEVFDDYYNKGGDDSRTSRFINKLISDSSQMSFPAGSTNEDKIEYIARQYVAKELPGATNLLLEFFKEVFGDWDSDKWGAKAALGFRNKIKRT